MAQHSKRALTICCCCNMLNGSSSPCCCAHTRPEGRQLLELTKHDPSCPTDRLGKAVCSGYERFRLLAGATLRFHTRLVLCSVVPWCVVLVSLSQSLCGTAKLRLFVPQLRHPLVRVSYSAIA
jgi:hypothetical protein